VLCSPHWSPSRKATANEQAPRNRSLSPSAVIILPGSTPHFHWAKSGEYVTQVTVMGPLGLEYLGAKDDPRNNDS